jgi:hypothetical protein
MKVYVDKETSDYIETKDDGKGSVDISIRAKTDSLSSVIITAKMNSEVLDKVIANLILLKSKVISHE